MSQKISKLKKSRWLNVYTSRIRKNADRIRKKYLAVVDSVFEKTNDLWEKFNCSNGTVSNSEYSSPSMMGWTAGVYRYLFEEK